MPVYKNKDNGTWYVMTQYTDWKGERKPKCKRGFATKREAQDWEQKFQQQSSGDLDMPFSAFVEIYCREQKPRLKESTWQTKENIIQQKILPYFKDRKINEITTKDVRAWQNEMLAYRNEENKPYSSSYLKTLHNQLSAIFNYAVRFYDLRSNPASKAGNMGSEERKEMLFWTKEEYQRFSEVMMDKPLSYYAFQMLYWTGIREGELLALTPADFDFEKGTVKISKTYQRLKGQDVITSPKTKKSNRTVQMPDFLCTEMQEFFSMQYGLKKKDRVFTVTKSYLHHEMERGAKGAGVKRIRIHDLRHNQDKVVRNLRNPATWGLKERLPMHFNAIVGNPPYHVSDGGAKASALPLYNLFFDLAKAAKPDVVSMIMEARWMIGGRGREEFRAEMLKDHQLVVLHDFMDSRDCFPNVDIKGGVCFVLWERGADRPCQIYTYKGGEHPHHREGARQNGNAFLHHRLPSEAIRLAW